MSACSTVAWGLQLQSGFPLPGMEPRVVVGLPLLRIELVAEQALPALWSGPVGDPEWVGRLGDGNQLRIERGAAGDRLFADGARARFHLDAGERTLTCAPVRPGLDWQRTLLGKVVPAVSVMKGYEALHGAALDGPGGAIAIVAPSGMGKSTLALELIDAGWELMADDVVALTRTGNGVSAHPGAPHMNLATGAQDGRREDGRMQTIGVLGSERWVSVRLHAQQARPLRAVVLLERGPQLALGVERLVSSPLPLAPYMLGVGANRQRRARRFALYGELAGSAALLRLRCGSEHPPAVVADELQEALA
jgi:HPr Serine kinase C-terminal domain